MYIYIYVYIYIYIQLYSWINIGASTVDLFNLVDHGGSSKCVLLQSLHFREDLSLEPDLISLSTRLGRVQQSLQRKGPRTSKKLMKNLESSDVFKTTMKEIQQDFSIMFQTYFNNLKPREKRISLQALRVPQADLQVTDWGSAMSACTSGSAWRMAIQHLPYSAVVFATSHT